MKSILFYGFCMAAFWVFLKWIDFNFLAKNHVVDVYLGIAALLFMVLGAWVFSQLKIKNEKTNAGFIASNLKVESLSKRESEVLELMVLGHSNQQIADILFVSIHTVKTHLSNIFVKLDVKNRTQAVLKAKEFEILSK